MCNFLELPKCKRSIASTLFLVIRIIDVQSYLHVYGIYPTQHKILFMNNVNDNKETLPRIMMITGGKSSGKTEFAESLALERSNHPTYLSTSRFFDEEMQRRIKHHQDQKNTHWRNIEAPLGIEELKFSPDEVVLVDNLSHWSNNWLFDKDDNVDEALTAIKFQIELLKQAGTIFIIVTDEIGLGQTSSDTLQNKLVDLQGMINQYISSIADEVYMVISGIPVKIKHQI